MNIRRARRLRRGINIFLLLVLACTLTLFVGCTSAEEELPQPTPTNQVEEEKQPQYGFTAEVKSLTDDTMRVSVLDPRTSDLRAGQYITLSTKTLNNSSLEGISVGFRVVVSMTDPIEENSTQPVVAYSIWPSDVQPR